MIHEKTAGYRRLRKQQRVGLQVVALLTGWKLMKYCFSSL